VEEAWELAAVSDANKESIEASVGVDGGSIKVVGGAASRIGHAAADALRFFTSPMGLAADEVDRFRIIREQSLRISLEKAKEKLLRSEVSEPIVSPKFLFHWAEGASLESQEDPNNLTDLWANLLASEAIEKNPNSLIYADILKKLSKSHADWLIRLSSPLSDIDEIGPDIKEKDANLVGHYIDGYLTGFFKGFREKYTEFNKDIQLKKFYETGTNSLFRKLNGAPGLVAISLSLYAKPIKENGKSDWEKTVFEAPETVELGLTTSRLTLQALAASELIEPISKTISIDDEAECKYEIYVLTSLGWDFAEACIEYDK